MESNILNELSNDPKTLQDAIKVIRELRKELNNVWTAASLSNARYQSSIFSSIYEASKTYVWNEGALP